MASVSCLGNYTAAAEAVTLVCEVFAAPGTAVETLKCLPAVWAGGVSDCLQNALFGMILP